MSNKQLAYRIGEILLVLLGISFITFCLVMLAPGDPVRQMIAGNEDIMVSQVEIEALRHELGLDKPFFFQYLDWLGRALQGNLYRQQYCWLVLLPHLCLWFLFL